MANHALLIGIDRYLYHPTLNNCVKDLTDFKEIIVEKFDFEESEVVELYNGHATNRVIQDTLHNYSRTLSYQDNLVIYFSGHGHFHRGLGNGHWIPADGTKNYVTWISNEILISILTRLECKHIFLLSDSCFSNALLVPSKGIKEYSNYKSRWALTSAFESAYDSPKGENGPFARAILEFLHQVDREFRVGELIEFVKSNFESNELQSPQGSAIYCKGHSGGEMVFQVKQQLDTRLFKGYTDFLKMLRLYRTKSNFVQLDNYENRSEKIGYYLLRETDPVIKKTTYYLYLFEGIVQSKTYKKILERQPFVLKETNLIVFLPKERGQLNPSARIGNVKQKLKPLNIFYVDEFIRDHCTPQLEFDKSRFLNLSNFIVPSLSGGIKYDKVEEYIVDWFDKEAKPIIAVKGAGGIGKTTFARFVADKWIERTPKAYVIYVDSVYARDILRRRASEDGLKLFDFYEAFCELSGSSSPRLTEELFRLNMDAGNILVVIDGLDEVISKIPQFRVEVFLESIAEISNELASGKVIITCRTHFWDSADVATDNQVFVIELEPFNADQARRFFEKSLDSKTKVKRALRLASEFKFPGESSENEFHPYVLDVIRSIVLLEKDAIKIDLTGVSSDFLNGNNKSDYIVFRICDREKKRVGQISVDDQIRCFIFMAAEKRGVLRKESMRVLLESALERKVDSNHANLFMAHPFLITDESNVSFRYDFLCDLFRGMYLVPFLAFESNKTVPDSTFLSILREYCWHGSPISIEAASRVKQWTDYDILAVAELVENISNGEGNETDKSLAIGNLFSLCLTVNHRFAQNNIDANTELLRKLFGKNDYLISNLALAKIDYENHIRFDFSNLRVESAFISEYGSFWDCKFNNGTRFVESTLLNLKNRTGGQSISKECFIDCDFDRDTEYVFRSIEGEELNRTEHAKEFLNAFFHLFFSNGRLGRQWEHKIIQPRFSGVSRNRFEYNETIKILKAHGILIVTREKGHNKFAVADMFKEDVERFTKDGTISKVISDIIIDLC
jgi:hypothetical protein